ncbi:MAG: hypothetical protein GXX79_12180 [Actinomycetales bacterium]|nr:hypothetical protein [Actinomycetales bacterium]
MGGDRIGGCVRRGLGCGRGIGQVEAEYLRSDGWVEVREQGPQRRGVHRRRAQFDRRPGSVIRGGALVAR